jgi:phosphatidylglycerophosphatase A
MRDLMKNIPPSTLSPIQRKIVITFTSSLGLGLSPFAPGTFGTLPALPLCWALSSLNKWGAGLLGYLAIGAVLYFLGVWASFAAERIYQKKDAGHISIDEIVGYMATMLLLPTDSWAWLWAGFFVFRFFDIVKPAPARVWQLMPGGWGVMVDDLVAGLYGCGLLQAVYWTGWWLKWW